MFEVWVDKNEPTVRLAVRQGSMLPSDLGMRDWTSLGEFHPTSEIERKIDQLGYHFFNAADPGLDPEQVKNDNASGA